MKFSAYLQAARSPSADHTAVDQDSVANVAEVNWLYSEFAPEPREAFEEAPNLVVATVGLCTRDVRRLVKLSVPRKGLHTGVHVTTVERLTELSYNIDVFLRH